MDRKQLLVDILNQSKIMEAALDAEDFEVFEDALDTRGRLIDSLEALTSSPEEGEERMTQAVDEIHGRCVSKLLRLKEKTGREIELIRAERTSMSKANQAQNKYQGILDTSSSLDMKK